MREPAEIPTLKAGVNCWRIERAARVSVIVDAADYFEAARSAMLAAERRIMLIGWDFDTRIKFEPEQQMLEGPNRLGAFLSWLPSLHSSPANPFVPRRVHGTSCTVPSRTSRRQLPRDR